MDKGKGLIGILLIVIGLILGLNALEITHIDIFFDGWWTLFIIVPSLISLFDDKESKTSSVTGLIIGIFLLLAARDIISLAIVLKLIFPFILVCVGVSFVFGDKIKSQVNEKVKDINKGDLDNIIATFSEQKKDASDEEFKGANLDAVFGSIVLDLRQAVIKDESVIKASAIFGGIDILLPEDVNVKLKATPIFGGVTNKIRNNKEAKKTIYIDAFSLFGGVDVK